MGKLTAGLGEVWQTMTVGHKRYAAHSTEHVPMTAELLAERADRIFTQFLALDDVENLRTIQF